MGVCCIVPWIIHPALKTIPHAYTLSNEAFLAVDMAVMSGTTDVAYLQFQFSYQTQEPILNVRRIMLNLAKQDHDQHVEHEIGQTWLEMARIARE